jgi:predicted aspartyl protease
MGTRTREDYNRQLRLADELFSSGRFSEAEWIYDDIGSREPNNPAIPARLGHVALLQNRLGVATTQLSQALAQRPNSTTLLELLAAAYYRQNDFPAAARYLAKLGRPSLAENLNRFANCAPYSVQANSPRSTVAWIESEPLPVIRATVNGHSANLAIDTGTCDLALDGSFAKEAGVALGGYERSTFAGGTAGITQHGHVNELTLGDFRVRDLPAQAIEIQPLFAPFFPRTRIDGIVGTAVLCHFLATLDYRNNALTLRRRDLPKMQTTARDQAIQVPFWVAGNCYVVAQGNIGRRYPSIMLLDTGMTGATLAIPRSTVQGAGFVAVPDGSGTGYGGGGSVSANTFALDQVCLGSFCQHDVTALILDRFPLEHQFGFRVGGLLAHDFFRGRTLTLDFDRMRLVVH